MIVVSSEAIEKGYLHRPVWFTVVGIVFVGVELLQVMKRSSVWCILSKHPFLECCKSYKLMYQSTKAHRAFWWIAYIINIDPFAWTDRIVKID